MRAFFVVSLAALLVGELRAQSPLEGAAFMAGCWQGAAGRDRVIEEYYTTPGGNLMQGMTRYLGSRDGAPGAVTVDFEFTLIDVDQDKTRLRPHPKGRPSATFAEVERSAGRLVWENAEHDFPQRISYTSAAGDSLIARIEGKTPSGDRAIEWRMRRAPCPGTDSRSQPR